MSEDGGWYTCEICGEGQLSEIAIRTHMYVAHVYDEVACMFCDLRGVTAEEMTLHINSVHCSDHNRDDGVHYNGSKSKSQQHLNGMHHDAEKQSTNQIHATRLPVESDLMSVYHDREAFVDLVDGNQPYSSNRSMSSYCNAEKGSDQSAGSVCGMNRDKQQKRKLVRSLVASSSCSGHEKTDLPPVCASSYGDADCLTSLAHHSTSSSQRLPKTALANHVDQTLQAGRFVQCSCLYVLVS